MQVPTTARRLASPLYRPKSYTPQDTPKGASVSCFPDKICYLPGIRYLQDRSAEPIFLGATGVKSYARCASDCSYCPIQHVFCQAMAQKQRLGRKDNQIHSFSLESECDTLTRRDRPSLCDHS